MSDLGETFRAYREHRRGKKKANAASSVKLLESREVPFAVLNAGNQHLLVCERFDFWPSTGKWIERKTGKQGRGVASLIRAARDSGGRP